MSRFMFSTALVLFSMPVFASAAGFAKQSLFLSKSPVTEGETVLIHAVVSNDATTKFDGEVIFKDGDTKIGSVTVAISAGGANAVSLSWKPAVGSHTITAELTMPSGSVVEQESGTFSIQAKPKPVTITSPATTSTTVESSEAIQQKIADLSPGVASVAEPVFGALDSLRQKAVQALDKGIDWSKQKTVGKTPGEVLGASTSGGWMDKVWYGVGLIGLYLFSILRWLVGNAGIFYPAFVIIFFYSLWRLYKRMTRPKFEMYQ